MKREMDYCGDYRYFRRYFVAEYFAVFFQLLPEIKAKYEKDTPDSSRSSSSE